MTKNAEPFLVRIVDDDPQTRESLHYMLTLEGYECVSYASAKDFLSQDMHSLAGCALLDVRMPIMSGLQCQEEMIRRGITMPIIFLSAHGDIDMAVDTMQKGAVAFIQKGSERQRLLDALARAQNSHYGDLHHPSQDVAKWQTLTPREMEVAQLVAQGLMNREIGYVLGSISWKTVQAHRSEISKKLGVKGAASLTQFVLRVQDALQDSSSVSTSPTPPTHVK